MVGTRRLFCTPCENDYLLVQADVSDLESSTILAFRYIADIGSGLEGLEKRQALKDWIDLLAASHPIDRCTSSSACFPLYLDQPHQPQNVYTRLRKRRCLTLKYLHNRLLNFVEKGIAAKHDCTVQSAACAAMRSTCFVWRMLCDAGALMGIARRVTAQAVPN